LLENIQETIRVTLSSRWTLQKWYCFFNNWSCV